MPAKACVVCDEVVKMRMSEYKMLDRNGPFVYSVRCAYRQVVGINCSRSHSHYKAETDARAMVSKLERPSEYYSVKLRAYFRSKTEGLFAECMVSRWNLLLQYEPYVYQVGDSTYSTDFFSRDYGCYIETKGAWMPSNRSKYRKFRELYPEIPLLVVPWPILETLL